MTPWTAACQASLVFIISQRSHSHPLSWWCHLTISCSLVLFSSCPQSFSASGSFLMSWLFASGGRSIGASASASVLPMNIQDWSPLELNGLIFLLSTAKSLQSCPTLCDPIDSSPSSSPVPGILQARTLNWVAISFSNVWKWKVKVKALSRVRLLATP